MDRYLLLRGLIVFGCLAVSLQQSRAAETAAPSASHLTVELRDGSRVVGDTDLPVVTIDTEITGRIKVPVSKIATLQFGSSNTPSVVLLRNGDRLKGTVQDASLKLTASFGKITIPAGVINKFNVAAAGNGSAILTDGLVLYYSFDADDGDTVKDMSGHGHDGRVVRARHVEDGVAGGAYQFDGQSYIRVPTAPDLQSAKFSVSVWVNSRGNRNQRVAGILGKHQAEDNQSFFVMRIQQQQIGMALQGMDQSQVLDTHHGCEPFMNQWGMLTLTYDGTTATAYYNGQPATHLELTGYQGNDHDLLIGAMELQQSGRSPQWYWEGLIDELRIYDRALSEDEVQSLYDSVTASKPAPAIGPGGR